METLGLAESVRVISREPDESKISTSYVERSNLTMRMGMRRMTRLTSGFSKKVENLSAAVALHFMYYNFARPHKTLGPKMTRRWRRVCRVTFGPSKRFADFSNHTDPLLMPRTDAAHGCRARMPHGCRATRMPINTRMPCD